ncbi:hypothetical protein GCM10009738_03420 [Kitasatospora viridis]|uniref:Uncharacterized protein n=1 Tax=Kitasatospora viridis TaxID=281105 RepID=A0A561SFS6_9ACTN|nr:hypothetical protein FHX73_15347 [Kitasatospora viridis]
MTKAEKVSGCKTCEGLSELARTDGLKVTSVPTAIERSKAIHRPRCPLWRIKARR